MSSQQSLQELSNITNTIQVGSSSLDIGGVGSVIGVNSQIIVANPEQPQNAPTARTETSSNTVAIIVGVVVGVVGAAAIAVGIFFITKKMNAAATISH